MTDPEKIPLLYPDPVIEAYLKDVDRTLLRAHLQLTCEERFEKFERFAKAAFKTLRAAKAELAARRP